MFRLKVCLISPKKPWKDLTHILWGSSSLRISVGFWRFCCCWGWFRVDQLWPYQEINRQKNQIDVKTHTAISGKYREWVGLNNLHHPSPKKKKTFRKKERKKMDMRDGLQSDLAKQFRSWSETHSRCNWSSAYASGCWATYSFYHCTTATHISTDMTHHRWMSLHSKQNCLKWNA